MGIITPLLDVVAGVAILAGRSSLLDTGVFKTANTNFTIRHILALGFIGVGVWNLERAQDKLKKSLGAESFGAEPMFVESDSLMVELMGFDGSYRTDGEVKVGYTTAAELGFEPKELKPVMWVWDDIEGYGAFMPTEKIRFIAEYFE
jgi:hypothetical protein